MVLSCTVAAGGSVISTEHLKQSGEWAGRNLLMYELYLWGFLPAAEMTQWFLFLFIFPNWDAIIPHNSFLYY